MIDKIEIKGYKSIKELELPLNAINIFIGANGVGKSNLISFFKLVQVLYEERLENFSLTQGVDKLLHFGRKATKSIYGYLQFDDTNGYGFSLQPAQSNSKGTLTIEFEKVLFNKRAYGIDGWSNYHINHNSKEAAIRNDTSQRISEHVRNYLKSLKIYHFHDTSDNAPLRSESNIEDNRYLKENGSNLPSYLYYLQQKHEQAFRRIEKTIQSVAPFFERFELEPQQLNKQSILLEWLEVTHSEKYFNALDLSDGTLRFIALATLLLQPKLPKTIIIDEPELGLHPVAVNTLAAMLQSAADRGSQVILSTQSVNLVNNFAPEDIITVDRVGDQSIFSRLQPQLLKHWLENDYSVGDLWSKSIIKGQP